MRGKGEREGKGTNLEACPLQPKRDDVQKADELGKDERLRGNVLCSESVELLNESFELGRGFPFLNAASKRQEKGRIASASFRERLDSAIGRRDRPGKVRTETLSRPRIPCLAILTFSGSCSTASASQSMVMEQLQTGQGAYDKSGTSLSAWAQQVDREREGKKANFLVAVSSEVGRDALSVESMVALW
jgi:hypothetical protein